MAEQRNQQQKLLIEVEQPVAASKSQQQPVSVRRISLNHPGEAATSPEEVNLVMDHAEAPVSFLMSMQPIQQHVLRHYRKELFFTAPLDDALNVIEALPLHTQGAGCAIMLPQVTQKFSQCSWHTHSASAVPQGQDLYFPAEMLWNDTHGFGLHTAQALHCEQKDFKKEIRASMYAPRPDFNGIPAYDPTMFTSVWVYIETYNPRGPLPKVPPCYQDAGGVWRLGVRPVPAPLPQTDGPSPDGPSPPEVAAAETTDNKVVHVFYEN